MREVRTTLETELENVLKIFHKRASVDAQYPYAVYRFQRLLKEDGIESHRLTIDLWDSNRTYSRIEQAADDIEEILDKSILSGDGHAMWLYADTMEYVEDEDRNIQHIEITFDVRVIRR